MSKMTLRRLRWSIAHWDRLRTGKLRRGEAPYASNCALCRAYIDKDCVGCPVSARTGITGCGGTPYHKAESIWSKHAWFGNNGAWSKAFSRAAEKEYQFLVSLLPPGKKP